MPRFLILITYFVHYNGHLLTYITVDKINNRIWLEIIVQLARFLRLKQGYKTVCCKTTIRCKFYIFLYL